ncbi:hypothetical protein TNCV_1989811 [Trichonephila clavipes]|nr:hypothetical protein TNCV_1989811 [Trichonephila clavipes]
MYMRSFLIDKCRITEFFSGYIVNFVKHVRCCCCCCCLPALVSSARPGPLHRTLSESPTPARERLLSPASDDTQGFLEKISKKVRGADGSGASQAPALAKVSEISFPSRSIWEYGHHVLRTYRTLTADKESSCGKTIMNAIHYYLEIARTPMPSQIEELSPSRKVQR